MVCQLIRLNSNSWVDYRYRDPWIGVVWNSGYLITWREWQVKKEEERAFIEFLMSAAICI